MRALPTFFLLLLAVPAAAQTAPAPSTLTLKEAIVLAKRHAFSSRIAEFREKAAAADVGQARVAFLPDLTGSVSKNASKRTFNSDYDLPTGIAPSDLELYRDSLEADLTASYVLVSSTRRLTLRAAQLRRSSQTAGTEIAQRQVVRDTARSYLQVVQSDALKRLAEQDLARRTRHLEESRALVKAGKRADFEVIRAEAELASSEASMVEARNNVRIARAILAQTVGTELPLDFIAERPVPPPDPRIEKNREMADMVSQSLARRVDIKAAEADAAIARMTYAQTGRRYLPTLSLFARYNQLLDANRYDPYVSNLTYGAQLEVRFSDTLLNVYRVQSARAESKLANVVADQTRVAISLEVERATLEADRASEVLSATTKSVDAARRNYESAAERYRLGVASQTERIEAESGLVEAEVDAARADVGYRVALWNLRYEMGETLEAL